jgi:hypothetical protein
MRQFRVSEHHMAWGPKSPDKIGLFWPVPPVENTSPHNCGPIADDPFGPLLIWTCKLLRKAASSQSPPPSPSYSLWHHRAAAKIGRGTLIHMAFWAWRLPGTKKFIKGLRKNLDITRIFLPFIKFKNIFTNNKVTALLKSVKPGKWKKHTYLQPQL